MSLSKPIILLVHGAWHHPTLYSLFCQALERLGYVVLCPTLPTLGSEAKGKTPADDVAHIRNLIVPWIEHGKEVIIVAHSYGGVPAALATEGLGRNERAAKGVSGGFKGVVFLSAFLIPERGMDVLSAIGGAHSRWIEASAPYLQGQLCRVNEEAKHVLFNDLTDAEADKYFSKLVPHSQQATETPIGFTAADVTIAKAYIICNLDQAIPRRVQEDLVARVPGMSVERIDAGHSAFLSRAEDTARLVDKIVNEM